MLNKATLFNFTTLSLWTAYLTLNHITVILSVLSSREAVLKTKFIIFLLILGKYMKIVESVKNYLFGSYVEMQKVTWPTKQQTINYSLLVVGLSVGVAVFFSILDYVFNFGIEQLITR